MTVLLLVGGLVALVVGAEALVRGASSLALSWGVPALVVGLTVVAFGTSAPEIAVSVRASLAGQGALAMGNVVGSNLFNVLVILGCSAVVAPLAVRVDLLRRDIPIMIGLTLLVWLAAWGGVLPRWFALGQVLLLLAYTGWLVFAARRDAARSPATEAEAETARPMRWYLALVAVAVGLALLVLGAGWFVDGAVAVARGIGLSELVIGLTIVAAGTSLPELATSVVAAWRGQRDIAIGNVIGSNVFNLLGVLGAAGLAVPGGLEIPPVALGFDLPLLLGISLLCWPLCRSGFVMSRLEGGLLALGYCLYVGALVVGVPPTGTAGRVLVAAVWIALGLGLGLSLLVLRRDRRV